MYISDQLHNYGNYYKVGGAAATQTPSQAGGEIFAAQTSVGAAKNAESFLSTPQAPLSSEANRLLLEEQERQNTPKVRQSVFELDLIGGTQNRDLDEFYATDRPQPIEGPINIRSVADTIVLPNAKNVAALSEHASGRVQQLLADFGIPEAPSSITFDQEGNLILPPDYEHAAAFREALEKTPGLERELRDLNAITSQFVGIQRAFEKQQQGDAEKEQQALIEEIKAEAEEKFFRVDTGEHAKIALNFDPDGTLNLSADGAPIKLKQV